ncbi:MAG: hypothetical protein OZ920_04045 [Burkholderiales bacterium]|nr:hypothetical protein [Burkholderiales bacterium]
MAAVGRQYEAPMPMIEIRKPAPGHDLAREPVGVPGRAHARLGGLAIGPAPAHVGQR